MFIDDPLGNLRERCPVRPFAHDRRIGCSRQIGEHLQTTGIGNRALFNAALVLLVVTSHLGPVQTELFTPGMAKEEESPQAAAT
jgi:hypothetical protein